MGMLRAWDFHEWFEKKQKFKGWLRQIHEEFIFLFFLSFLFFLFLFHFFFYSCNFKERWGVTKICEVSRSRNFYRISKNLEILVASFWYGMSSHPCFLFLEQTSTKSYSLNYFFLKKKSTKLRHLIFCR